MSRITSQTLLLACALCTAVAASAASPRYRISVIDPGSTSNVPVRIEGINNKGELVGGIDDAATGQTRAFFWRDGELTILKELSGVTVQYASATAVNDRSVVLGSNFTDTALLGVIWREGRPRDMGLPAEYQVIIPSDINNLDQVAGNAFRENETRPFIWYRGRYRFLEHLHPAPEVYSQANQINDSGQVVGASSGRAVLWQGGDILDLVPESVASTATAINNRAEVVGYALVSDSGTAPGFSRAFVWREGRIRTLPPLPLPENPESFSFGINNEGLVTGYSCAQEISYYCVATLWRNGTPVDLNELIHRSDPLRPYVNLVVAEEINDRGQIVAHGQDSRNPGPRYSFVLTPVH